MQIGYLGHAGFVVETEQRSRVAHREPARPHFGANFVGQLQQTHVVRDRRAIFSDGRRDVFLPQLKLVAEPVVRLRFFDRIEIFTLNVFDERHLKQRLLLPGRDVADDDGNAEKAGEFGCTPAAFARRASVPASRPR